MLKLVDKIYFRIRDRFDRGAVQRAYDEGLHRGADVMKSKILSNLRNGSPHNFKSDELKLGFYFAEGIVKDTER